MARCWWIGISKREAGREHLCERELVERQQRATERRIRAAKLPTLKTIESFWFDAQASIDESLVRELLGGEFLDRRENVLLIGNSGTGKTHLATTLGLRGPLRRKKSELSTNYYISDTGGKWRQVHYNVYTAGVTRFGCVVIRLGHSDAPRGAADFDNIQIKPLDLGKYDK